MSSFVASFKCPSNFESYINEKKPSRFIKLKGEKPEFILSKQGERSFHSEVGSVICKGSNYLARTFSSKNNHYSITHKKLLKAETATLPEIVLSVRSRNSAMGAAIEMVIIENFLNRIFNK